jgi:biopolymer transport protein ExbB
MKKLFAILAVMGVLTLGSVQPVMAQDAAPAQTEQTMKQQWLKKVVVFTKS